MIQFLLIVILALAVTAAAAVLAARARGKRAVTAEAEAASLRSALSDIREKAGRLQKAIGQNAKAEEKADEERKELARTADTGLVNRANSLF